MSVTIYPNLLEEVEEESYETAETMDPALYRAITVGDVLGFFRVMNGDNHHAPAPCVELQLGPRKNTILHIAAIFKQYEIVKIICKDLPCCVADKNAKGDVALHIAARAGDSLLVTLLINTDFKEGGLGEKNGEGNTPLHEALKFGHEEVARILINKNRYLPYSLNKEGKSILYLAAEAGFITICKLIAENLVGDYNAGGKHKTKSPVFAAILGNSTETKTDVLKLLWDKDRHSFYIRGSNGKNPLHVAVCSGYIEGVKFLLKVHHEFAYQKDRQGLYPIHSAAQKGLIDIIKFMIKQRPDMRELLTADGQNILHLAARSGKCQAIDCMLKMPELKNLINDKDEGGNTPLHLATFYCHPKMILILAKNGISLKVTNNKRQTALDTAEDHMETALPSFQKRLTWMALKVLGAPRARVAKCTRCASFKLGDQMDTESWRDKVNVVLLVAIFIATVTFTAGFTLPGGYKNSSADEGYATMIQKVKFQEFLIFDTIAMFTSIIVAIILLWAQQGDPGIMHVALKIALPLCGMSLIMMSIAFTAGVCTVVSNLSWLANAIMSMGMAFTVILVIMITPLCFLGSTKYPMFKRVSYYPFCLVLYTLGT